MMFLSVDFPQWEVRFDARSHLIAHSKLCATGCYLVMCRLVCCNCDSVCRSRLSLAVRVPSGCWYGFGDCSKVRCRLPADLQPMYKLINKTLPHILHVRHVALLAQSTPHI